MNITSHLNGISTVTINPLKKDENVAALKSFIEIIKTSIGPYGKLKIIQNAAGGHVTVTSSSQRLLHIVCVKNTFLRMIVSSAKVHLTKFGDGGLSCIFLTLNLINNSSSLIYPLPLIGKLYEHFGNIFINYLTAEHNSVISLDVSDLKSFQSVAQTVLHSKPGCMLKQSDVHHLSILLLKVLFNSLPSAIPLIFHKNINFVTLEGTNCDRSRLYDGLLIKLSEKPLRNLSYLKNKSNIKIVLFTISLSGDAEFPVDKIEVYSDVLVWETVLKFLKNVIQKVINAEVHILACQKVVHPSLRKQLEDANILVLDRLGYEVSKHLEYLSGIMYKYFIILYYRDKNLFAYSGA